MVTEIRIYVEGGGDGKDSKAQVRQGFSQFLGSLRTEARSRRIKWQIIACGSRSSAYRDFKNALEDHPNAFNILLVDSEGPVTSSISPWQHLNQRDGWQNPGVSDEQCHLMVQMIEAWLVADINTLRQFYGQGFNANPIPNTPNVEIISKNRLEPALRAATRRSTKGEYHKIKHGPRILERVDVDKVRRAASYCDRMFNTLIEKMA